MNDQTPTYSSEVVSEFEAFKRLTLEHMKFLIENYDFRLEEAMVLLPTFWVKLTNDMTQVSVYCEHGSELWVAIGQRGSVSYNLDHLLFHRTGQEQPIRVIEDFDDGTADEVLRHYAVAMQNHASDVLRGDFTVFPILEEIQEEASRQRIKEAGYDV